MGEDGTVVERVAYDTWGVPWVTTSDTQTVAPYASSLGNRLLFQSHLWDPDVDLYFMRARVFDPFRGEFLQRDPSGYADSVNMYAGFANDPVNLKDPTGEKIICPEGQHAVFMLVDGIGREVCSGNLPMLEEAQRNSQIISSMYNIASGVFGTLAYASCRLFTDDIATCGVVSWLGAVGDSSEKSQCSCSGEADARSGSWERSCCTSANAAEFRANYAPPAENRWERKEHCLQSTERVRSCSVAVGSWSLR